MEIRYKTKKLRKECLSIKEAKKAYSGNIPEKLHAAINYIESASSLVDVINYPPFHFHPLDHDKKGLYAIDIAGRRSSYRLLLVPINNNNEVCSKDEIFGGGAINIVIVQLEEVSKHYE